MQGPQCDWEIFHISSYLKPPPPPPPPLMLCSKYQDLDDHTKEGSFLLFLDGWMFLSWKRIWFLKCLFFINLDDHVPFPSSPDMMNAWDPSYILNHSFVPGENTSVLCVKSFEYADMWLVVKVLINIWKHKASPLLCFCWTCGSGGWYWEGRAKGVWQNMYWWSLLLSKEN